MPFLSLASAWFALALPAIAALYILKRTYQDKEVSSHLLWRRVLQEQEANRPWQKLRSRLLLILQLLAALFIILALMEPVMSKPAVSTGHAVLLIDRAASMAIKPNTPNHSGTQAATRLELALEQANQWLNEQPRNRPITIVTTGAQPEVLVSRVTNKEQVNKQLQAISPFYGKSDPITALSLADSLLQGDPTGETVIFTDGSWQGIKETKELNLHAPVDLHLIDEQEPHPYLSILYFGIKADPVGNGTNRGTITVRNDSKLDQNVQLEVLAKQDSTSPTLAAEASVLVAAGEWQSVDIDGLPEADYYKAQLRKPIHAASMNDSAYQFPTVPRTKQALLVSKGNLFLEKALMLAGVQTVKMSPDSMVPTGQQGDAIDFIILDGMDNRLLADSNWSKLLSEKPIWMIDHPEQSDEAAAVPAHSRVVTKEHAVTTYITFADTHIGRLAKPDSSELSWGEAVLTYGDIPAIYAGEAVGKPRLRFTFNFQDTDLPLRPEFPILIVQAAQWMSGGSELAIGTRTADQPMELSLHSETVKAAWQALELTGAGFPSEQVVLKQPLELDLSALGLTTAPPIPGLYQLIERNAANTIISSRYLAVTADSTEFMSSKEMEASGVQLLRSLKSDAVEETSSDSIDENGREQQVSLQMWVALFVLLLMAVEWEVYRRGHSS